MSTIVAEPRPIRTWDGRHHGPIKRILQLYRQVDDGNAELARLGQHITTCRAGCSHCCEQWIGTWYLEAIICLAEAERVGYDLSQRLVTSQRDTLSLPDMTRERWFGLHNPCVFLRSDKLCGIYHARPLSCRAVYVTSEASMCGSATGVVSRVDNRDLMREANRRMLSEHVMCGIRPAVVAALPVMLDLVLRGGKPADLAKKDGVYGLADQAPAYQAS